MGRKVWVPVVSGPLARYAAEYSSWLASREYSLSAAADRLYQFDQLSRGLAREELDPALKEQAIARTAPLGTKPGRYRPPYTLLAFLEGL